MSLSKWFCYAVMGMNLCAISTAEGWQSHFLMTAPIVASMQEVGQQPSVPAETLSDFLEAESVGLVTLLKNIDNWPKQVGSFPALPAQLTFKGKSDTERSLLQQFTDRARIHPQTDQGMHYDTLFVEYAPGQVHRITNPLQLNDIVLASIINDIPIANPPLERVNVGQLLSPFEIITSAVDEPDFGMDVGLFEDNGTEFGKKYQLGNTPELTNKDLAIGTQAPFHMGYFYENSWIKGFGPDLTKMYPEYRIHFFITLSQYAFKQGHPYWGYRFLGWAIHYLQDLTQPYHTKLVPGMITIKVLLTNRDIIKNQITNKHLALESYQYSSLLSSMNRCSDLTNNASPLISALSNSSLDTNNNNYNDLYPREVVAHETSIFSHVLDDAGSVVFSKIANGITHTSDGLSQSASKVNFGSINQDILSQINQNDPEVQELNQKLVSLFKRVRVHTRQIILFGLKNCDANGAHK